MKDSKGLRIVLAVFMGICTLPVTIFCIVGSFVNYIVEWVKDVVETMREGVDLFVNFCKEPCKETTIESEENVVLDEEGNEL